MAISLCIAIVPPFPSQRTPHPPPPSVAGRSPLGALYGVLDVHYSGAGRGGLGWQTVLGWGGLVVLLVLVAGGVWGMSLRMRMNVWVSAGRRWL